MGKDLNLIFFPTNIWYYLDNAITFKRKYHGESALF